MNFGTVEYSHPSKFLASLGVGLVLAGIGAQFLLNQVVQPMLISLDEYDRLTDSGRKLVDYRLNALEFMQSLAWPFTISAVVIGGLLAALGLWSWWRLQSPQDQVLRYQAVDAIKDRRTMTPQERRKKLEAEADESIKEEQEAALAEPQEVSGVSEATESIAGQAENPPALPTASSGIAPAPVESVAQSRSDRLSQIATIEATIGRKLEEAYSGTMAVQHDQQLNRTAQLDFVLTPLSSSSLAEVGIEVMVSTRSTMVLDRILGLALASLGLRPGQVYTGRQGRPPIARSRVILILVAESSPRAARLRNQVRRQLDTVNSVLKEPVGLVVIDISAVDGFDPVELRTQLASAMVAP